MDHIKVSVSCTVYNQKRYVRKCLDGLVNQKTDFRYEVIVHDDASPDGSAGIIREYENRYPQIIKAVYQPQNRYSVNPVLVQDAVYSHVQGDYVAFCEGDDYWCDDHKLQKQYDLLQSHPDCSLCVHKVRKVKADGTETEHMIAPGRFEPGIIDGNRYIRELFGSHNQEFQTSSYFIRKDVLFSMPQSIRDAYFVGDIPLLLWASVKGSLYYLGDICSCYRVLSAGSTNEALKNREYAIMRVKTSVDGNLAFNRATEGAYWDDMKHDIMRKKAQLYYVDKKMFTKEEAEEIFSALSLKERLIAVVKFTKAGNFLRNIRQDILRTILRI